MQCSGEAPLHSAHVRSHATHCCNSWSLKRPPWTLSHALGLKQRPGRFAAQAVSLLLAITRQAVRMARQTSSEDNQFSKKVLQNVFFTTYSFLVRASLFRAICMFTVHAYLFSFLFYSYSYLYPLFPSLFTYLHSFKNNKEESNYTKSVSETNYTNYRMRNQ